MLNTHKKLCLLARSHFRHLTWNHWEPAPHRTVTEADKTTVIADLIKRRQENPEAVEKAVSVVFQNMLSE